MATAVIPMIPASSSMSRGMAFAVVSFACFSIADAIVKLLGQSYSVFQLMFTMAVAALIPMSVTLLESGGLHSLRPRRPWLVLLRGALAVTTTLLVWNAFTRLPLADAYTLMFTTPMLVTALSVPLLGEIVGWRRWSAVIVGFMGVLVMIRPGFVELNAGHLMTFAAALSASLSFILLRRIGGTESRSVLMLAVILSLIAISGPMLPAVFVMPDSTDLLIMALGGILIGLGQAGIIQAVREAPAAIVTPFQYSQMLWAIGFGLVLFGDRPDPWMLAGAAIVIGSGLYIFWRETVRRSGGPGAQGSSVSAALRSSIATASSYLPSSLRTTA